MWLQVQRLVSILVSRDQEHDQAIRKSCGCSYCLLHQHEQEQAELIKQVDQFWELDAWESMYITNEPAENFNEHRGTTNQI